MNNSIVKMALKMMSRHYIESGACLLKSITLQQLASLLRFLVY